jgi:hypothetical protein
VLYNFWVQNYAAFNGDVVCDLAAQFLVLAKKQGAIVPLMVGHRLMGTSLVHAGDIAEGRAHFDRAIGLYDPAVHRPLATRFGQDVGVVTLSHRSIAQWCLGFPEAALADTDHALKNAREIGQAVTLTYALVVAQITRVFCRDYSTANALVQELVALADEIGSSYYKAFGTTVKVAVWP